MKVSKKMGFASVALGVILLAGCGADTDPAKDSTDNQGATQNEEQAQNENIISLNHVVADDNVIKATLTEIETIEDDVWGNERKIVFDIENKSGQDIIIQSEKVSSDGRMVDESFITMSTDIAAGKQAEAVLSIIPFEEEMPTLEKDFEMTLKVLSSDFDRIGEYQVQVDVSNK